MIPKEEYIDHPLYGRRVLHFMSPVRWRGPKFEHEKCSNYKVLEKTIGFLPMCHHFVLTPENHEIPDDRDNVTLIPFDYAGSVTLNRGHMNAKDIVRMFNLRGMDLDFIFNHQPELTYGIINGIQSARYGAFTKVFNFFHWLDTPQTKPTDVFPDGYIRQLEAIHLAERSVFHSPVSLDYIQQNFKTKKERVFDAPNMSFIKKRTMFSPLGVEHHMEPEPFPIPTDKKILLFNHRWAKTTGVRRLVEYTEGLSDEYMIWVTDTNAADPRAGNPAPDHFHVEGLSYPKYLYLLQNCHATLGFVDGYMDWNLSVQDAITFNTPLLVYSHPTNKYILGDDYPLSFKTKDDFVNLLNNMPQNFEWTLPPHDETFKNNLLKNMIETLGETRIPVSKYNNEWYHHIISLQNNAYKAHLLKNSHPDLYSSNVWEGLRLKAMDMGVRDDPTSKFTRFFIPNEEVKKRLIGEINGEDFGESQLDLDFERVELQKDIKESIKKQVNREKKNNSNADKFFGEIK